MATMRDWWLKCVDKVGRLQAENADLRQQLAAWQARARQGARLLNWVRSYWQGKLLLPHPDLPHPDGDESGLAELFDEISAWLKEKSDDAALKDALAAARRDGLAQAAHLCDEMALQREQSGIWHKLRTVKVAAIVLRLAARDIRALPLEEDT